MNNLFATGIVEDDSVRMFCDELYQMVDFRKFRKGWKECFYRK